MECLECKKEFIAKNSKEKICSDECRKTRQSNYNKKQFENGKRNTLKKQKDFLIQDLNNGLKYSYIANKYDCSSETVCKIAKEIGIQRLNKDHSKMINFLELKFSRIILSSSNRKEKMYIASCKCGFEKEIPSHVANRLYKINKKYECDTCSKSKPTRSVRASKHLKRKNNTTGFIGVWVNQYRGDIIGYKSVIISNEICVFRNRYKDDTLNDKTLIQAAIDRDIFIIENNLPHTRNFTDFELFANMEYLAYNNINTLKEKLQQN